MKPLINQLTVNTLFTSAVTLTLIAKDGSGTMGSTTCTAVSGVCTISSCAITGYGTFIFQASASSQISGYSTPFTVTSGSVSTVTLASVTTTVYRGQTFSVSATVLDSSGIRVTSSLQFYLSVSSGSGQIAEGSSATLSLGTLSFTNVIIDRSGSHTLTVTCPSCSAFTVTTTTVTVNTYGLLVLKFADGIVEGGSQQAYTINLSTQPSDTVTVSIVSADSSVLSISTTSLTFTTSNYATAQTVYMDVGSILSATNPYTVLVSHSISSNDWTYSGTADMQSCMVSSTSISIPIYGYQEVSINVDMAAAVSEVSQVLITVSIGSAPTSDVTINISTASSLLTLSASKVIFTSTSWAAKQFSVTGPASGSVSTYTTASITYSVSTSDANYGSASVIKRPNPLTTSIVITPKTSYAIKLDTTAVMIMSKHYESYFVRLSSNPTNTVTMTLTSASTNIVVSPSTLTFSSSSGTTYQEVTLYAANSSPSSSPSYTVAITHSTSSSDSNYSGLSATFTASVVNICLNLPYNWPSAAICSCPAGFNCKGNDPVPCPAGTYSLADAYSCTACPAGSSCANPGVSPVACTSGYYSYDYYTACYPCPSGYYCASTNGYLMKRCVQGSYSGPGSSSCTTPSAGNMAPSPEYALAIACPTGYYSQGSTEYCVPCPGGYSCSGSTATLCTVGYYSLPGMGTCTACPDHHECDPAMGPSRICPEGTYRLSTSYNCDLCTAGNYCTDSEATRPVACPSGYTSVIGSSYCTSSSGTYDSYPGLDLSGTTFTVCAATGNYACFVGPYTSFITNIKCTASWGRCYPIPGGESDTGTLATAGQYSYIGSQTIATGFLGFNIPAQSDRPDMIGFECQPGYYCASTTASTTCGNKKFNPTVRAYDSTFCFDCPPGYQCSSTSIGDYEQYPCPGGSYCKAGVSSSTNCPAGTYRNKLRGIEEGSCDQCPDGYYCAAGTTNPTVCPRGYICPIGSSVNIPCPEGTYNQFTGKYKIEDCVICPAGSYCAVNSAYYVWCPPGTYNPYQGSSACFPCTAGYACIGFKTVTPYIRCSIGYYCPESSTTPIQYACPPGTIGTIYGAYSKTQCEKCPPGFYCGFHTEYLTNPPIACPAGYYCPIGTEFIHQYPCPVGTYNAKTRVEGPHECLTCPEGYYCLNATTSATSNICPQGYFCPRGTTYAKQYSCEAGSYGTATGATLQGDCTTCPPGSYCPQGSTAVINCPAGTYMNQYGATDEGPGEYPSCIPCPAGYYSASAGSTTCTAAGVGKYTYEGTTAELSCLIGYFCAESATSEYIMYSSPCPPGYLCSAGMSTYPDYATNGCPVGKYCLEGANAATPCPAGTYRNTVGARSIYDCATVPAGYYISATGASSYSSNPCSAGYYCPEGSITATAYACPKGTFRLLTGGKAASDCAFCPPGYYCPNLGMSVLTGFDCPATKYCPSGTITPIQCPSGTYSSITNLKTSSECTSCDAGSYCASPGLSAVTADCYAGYYCIGGSTLEAPTDGVTGALCPAGGYCLSGDSVPNACSAGTFNNFAGGWSSADCVNCWPGYYCLSDNNPSPTAQCDAGYYCTGGATTAQQNQATAGNYAPLGSVAQIPCLQGTYNPSVGQSACLSCPAGAYCPSTSMTTYTTCAAGTYCTTGSYIETPCPAGTFRAGTGGQSVDECTACTNGNYCLYYGLSAITSICDAGYYCIEYSFSKQPWIESAGQYGRCPRGAYCPAGTSTETPCPAGYYNPSYGAEDSTGCVKCPAGYACPNTGTINYSVDCRRGYFCNEGSTTSQPAAALCTAGHECPTGSAVELKCAAGTYQDNTGAYTCKTCPPGYYCPINSSGYISNLCPAGYYCPSGTTYSTQYPCPAGTFNPLQGQQTNDACQSCSSGSYCNTKGASAVTGPCDPGFYCNSGSTSSRPRNTSEGGGRCTQGFYCPSGSSSAVSCDPGSYCPDDQMSAVAGDCYNGYYCTSEATSPTPTDGTTGNICSAQYYCPAGSSIPTQCDTGLFIPYTGASADTECLPCTPGFYCDGDAVTPLKDCPVGYYCPGGDTSPTYECDRGYMCPLNSAEPTLCLAGTYQPDSIQGTCLTCDAGFYCNLGAYAQTLCPKGYYCTSGTTYAYQYPCPVGTYNSNIGMSSLADCTDCPGGKYCSTQGAEAYTGLCSAGYYCISSTEVATPTDGTTGNICSEGYYCPEGSSSPTDCDAGMYCNQKALSDVSGSCAAGYYCILNAVSPVPTDGTTGDKCSSGHYCPSESSSEEDCPAGTYGASDGLSSLSECLPCSYGKYCSITALSSPQGNCDPGYYCDPGKDSKTPIDGVCPVGYFCDSTTYYVKVPCFMGYVNTLTGQYVCDDCSAGYYCEGATAVEVKCPKGYYCPTNTRFSTEFPCGPGYYSSVLGNSVCSSCPEGYQCNNAAQTPNNLCPTYKYCPALTGYGILCPAGTYNKDYQGLTADTECTTCPAGQYCVDGTISGQCSPGFWCKGGSATPTPVTETTEGLPCPPGYYCPKGTVTPTICPEGKFRADPGAQASTDCTSCPPGYYCVSGITTPFLCTTGHYCPLGIQTPLSCPKRTYNDVTGADNINFCKICPAGYLCDTTGIALYTDHPCTPGYFCVEGATGKINCPPGTYTYANNAGSKDDCYDCPSGFYCPANTTNIISCPLGSYCPGGNALYWPCPPGYLCYEETADPEPCPSGFYCPLYDKSNSTINPPPVECTGNTLCPGGTFDESICTAGYYYLDGYCNACPAGYYSDGQNSDGCSICQAGYICTGAATRKDPRSTNEGGYACPVGYYCPLGVLSPIPCPISTYNYLTATTSLDSCIICPVNTYGDQVGQSACQNCGSHAISTEGNTTCTCIGLYRNYQKYDGSCFCLPTYEFIVNGVASSEVDSSADCYPIVYANCQTGQERAADGSCVDPKTCENSCSGNAGVLDPTTGLCVCENTVSENDICDSTCINSLPSTTLSANGDFEIYDPSTGQTVIVSQTSSNYLSSVTCTADCVVHSLTFTDSGPTAQYGVATALQKDYYSNSNRRRLDVTSEGISNALACINVGDTFVFSLSPKNNFPVYLKDSLLNTNKDFDYSAFKELLWRMQSDQSDVSIFAFTFIDAGIYDFVDNADHNNHVIIVVKATSENCPSSTTVFYARTEENLRLLGLSVTGGLVTTAEWGVIAGIIVATFIVLLILIAFLAFLHWRSWATSHARERLLKLVKDCCKRCRVSKPALVSPIIIEDEGDSIDIDRDLLEPSQFTDMLQKLTRYFNQLQAAFDSQDEDAKRSLEDLLGQAKDLKIMLGDRLSDVDPALLREKLKEAKLESSDSESTESIPEIAPVVENVNFAMNAFVDFDNTTQIQKAEEMQNKILANPNLLDKDKEELLNDLNANMQRIEQALDRDWEQAQNDINKRLQERIARRRAAEREKAYLEPKRKEIIVRNTKELGKLEKELEEQVKMLDQEFVDERDKVKMGNRKEIDEKLKDMRSKLQNDLMSAKSQVEIDNLLKIFEIESKRIEDQVRESKKQQEADVLKRLEERRQKRLEQLRKKAEEKKSDFESRNHEELNILDQRALLAVGKVSVEIQLDMHEEQVIIEAANNFEFQKAGLAKAQANEIANIDKEIQVEEQQKAAEKERLEALLKSSDSAEEKAELMRALEQFESAQQVANLKQEDNLKMKLLERKRKRAEREALLKAKHENELKELDLKKHDVEKELRSGYELKKMEEILSNSENHTPEELIAMARELLEAKHDRETATLTGLKHSKLREYQNDSVHRGLAKKAEEKEAQRAIYESQKSAIKKEKMDPKIKQAKLEELEVKLQEAETQIDFAFIIGMNAEQDRIWREAEDDYKEKFIDLANAQTREIQEIMGKIKGADVRMLEANMADMEREISNQRAELGRKHAEKLRELEKREMEIKELEKQKMGEIDFINNQLREVEEKQRKIDEVQEQRRVMEERQRKVLEAMKEKGISPEKMEEILKQHQLEMDEWEKAMENERVRQQQKLQAKLDIKKQKYQEKIASQIQKYKEQNLKLIEQQEEAEVNRLKIVVDIGRELKIWTPKVEIETKLRFPDLEEEQEIAKIASTSILDEVVTRVRRVETIAENIDSTQFNLLLKAFAEVTEMMDGLKSRF